MPLRELSSIAVHWVGRDLTGSPAYLPTNGWYCSRTLGLAFDCLDLTGTATTVPFPPEQSKPATLLVWSLLLWLFTWFAATQYQAARTVWMSAAQCSPSLAWCQPLTRWLCWLCQLLQSIAGTLVMLSFTRCLADHATCQLRPLFGSLAVQGCLLPFTRTQLLRLDLHLVLRSGNAVCRVRCCPSACRAAQPKPWT